MKLSSVLGDPDVLVDALGGASGVQARIHSHLDVDVYRVEHDGPGPDWVVRAFDDAVGRPALESTARVLAAFGETPFPAERCVGEHPVITFSEDGSARHLLVTEHVEARPAPRPGFVLAWCAALLARLATRPGETLPPGGGWHRLGPTPSLEIDAALRLASEVEGPAAGLLDQLADADDANGLPEAMIHPDMAPPNAIAQGDSPPVIIDWLGVGRGPRVWPLAFLLFAAGPRGAPTVVERYRRSITLTDEEWQRLPDIMRVRPLTLDLWSVAYERLSVEEAITRSEERQGRIRATVAAVHAARAG